MNANYLKRILILFGVLLMSLTGLAEPSSSDPSGNGDAVLVIVETNPIKKRIPSRNFLEVTYSEGSLTLSSNFYEGEYSIQFVNIASGESLLIPSISVGETVTFDLIMGEYEIRAENSEGQIFNGFMEVF